MNSLAHSKLLILLILVLFSMEPGAAPSETTKGYIVTLKEGVKQDTFITDKKLNYKDIFANYTIFNGFAIYMDQDQFTSLKSSSEVEFVEPDLVMTIASKRE